MTTPRDMDFDLHLPAGTRDVFLKRIKEIPEDKRTSWRFHVVRAGESLDGIAAQLARSRSRDRHGESARRRTHPSTAGDELVVPVHRRRRGAASAALHHARAATRWSPLPTASTSRWKSCGAGIISRRARSGRSASLAVVAAGASRAGDACAQRSARGAEELARRDDRMSMRRQRTSRKTCTSKTCASRNARRRARAAKQERSIQNENETAAADKLPHEKDCLPSLAHRMHSVARIRAVMKDVFLLHRNCEFRSRQRWKYEAARRMTMKFNDAIRRT